MRTFLRKIIVALLIAALLHAAAGFLADGTTDAYYLRFTTGKQRSMILGGSRAAQGLHPAVFNDHRTSDPYEGPLYNFAFTMAHSPYGPTYLHAIQQKLDTTTRNGLFILQVDPWLLSNPADQRGGSEADRTLGLQWTWNMDPNYEYLVRYWDRGWGALGHWPMGDRDTSTVLLSDGRLVVKVDTTPFWSERRNTNKLRTFREEYLPGRQLSALRLDYLERTIAMLRPYGTVVLARLPVSPQIVGIENSFAPGFTDLLNHTADATGATLIDLDTMQVSWTDGNHLDEPSGRRVSEALRSAIQRVNTTNL